MAQHELPHDQQVASVRETVESIWIAIVLAFVLRAFVLEAFMIPTGSMAPRLMGQHFQRDCLACGYHYAVRRASEDFRGRPASGERTTAECPNCRFRQKGPEKEESFGGDRVLVLKYLYRFRKPRSWDVVVFKNPLNNQENYIKRLIGLPGETIELVHGDVFVRVGDGPWQIRRKPHEAQEAMWQIVFHNDYQPDMEMLARQGAAREVPKWVPDGEWETSLQGRRFTFTGDSPSDLVFQADEDAFLPHYGYNQSSPSHQRFDRQSDVISDLRLSFVYTPQEAGSSVSMRLTSFEHGFQGELCADGTAVIRHDPPDETEGNWEEWGRTQIEPIAPGESRLVALSHVDFRLTLWVDGQAVLVSSDEQYAADHEVLIQRMQRVDRQWASLESEDGDEISARRLLPAEPIPTPQVALAAAGGPCRIDHLKLERDVYYTNSSIAPATYDAGFARVVGATSKASGWGTTGRPITLWKFADSPELDQFFLLGDNSPQSHDGRSWTDAAPTLILYNDEGEQVYQLGTVPRCNLIGKAFFVYWPSGYAVPGLPGLPVIPNVGKMRLIR